MTSIEVAVCAIPVTLRGGAPGTVYQTRVMRDDDVRECIFMVGFFFISKEIF